MSTSETTRWIPLESNPDVFNSWAGKAGLVTSKACFHDVYGLENELLDLVPQPTKAVILLFPITGDIEAYRGSEDEALAKEDKPQFDTPVMWIKQTIGNACGTMALLHALANTDTAITPESPLSQFIDECKDKTPLDRAKLLETTPLFANIHAQLAEEGQSTVPTDLQTDLHFTCFVQTPKGQREPAGESTRIIELDGGRVGPIDRGKTTSQDFLKDVAKFVKETYFQKNDTVLFSLMALAPPADD